MVDNAVMVATIVIEHGRSPGHAPSEAPALAVAAKEFLSIAKVADFLGLCPVTSYGRCRTGVWRVARGGAAMLGTGPLSDFRVPEAGILAHTGDR